MQWKRWIIGRWNWFTPIRLLAVAYLSLHVVACSLSNKLIFLPPEPQYGEDASHLEILDPGEDQIACLFRPPAENQPVLLWAHGNAEDIGHLQPLVADFHARGLGVLAYDYPGYGLSAGSPGERTCYRAAGRAYDFLVVEQNIARERIILVGQSVGSGPACWLAERERVGGLVLIAPFLSAFRSVTHFPIIPGDKFKNLKRIRKIEAPLLVIHGSSDEMIPFRQGQRLYREHRGPKQFLEITGSGHNDLWADAWEEMAEAIVNFARESRE